MKILPVDLSGNDVMTEKIQLYQPSNSSEGHGFISQWCGKCARDLACNGTKHIDDCGDDELCEILVATFRCDIDDLEYPKEWQRHPEKGPICTAFVPKGELVKPAFRDDRTY